MSVLDISCTDELLRACNELELNCYELSQDLASKYIN